MIASVEFFAASAGSRPGSPIMPAIFSCFLSPDARTIRLAAGLVQSAERLGMRASHCLLHNLRDVCADDIVFRAFIQSGFAIVDQQAGQPIAKIVLLCRFAASVVVELRKR
ncbi:hypothetical protein PQQ86_32710 [Paraburkholderia sediminicola]|uniref:hypothetical protein n=1 Tax=Paraburkholderia sediminicola TaxID=458836 RepID=UPI0038BDA22C